MCLFAFAAPFVGKGDKLISRPVHIRDEAMELVLHSFTENGLEGKLHTGKDGLSEGFSDGEEAVGLSLFRVGKFFRYVADLRLFAGGIESLPFFGRQYPDLLLESIGHRGAHGKLDPPSGLSHSRREDHANSLPRRPADVIFFTPSGILLSVSLKTRRRS